MAGVFFVNGIPAQIDKAYFRARYGQNFPDLLPSAMDTFLDAAITDVYTMFTGVNTIWSHMSDDTYFAKTQLCFGLLLAWYITDMYPEYSVGVVTSSGIPLKSKSIGGIKLTFGDPNAPSTGMKGYKDSLAPLKGNAFGNKAYLMLTSSSSKIRILGR